MDTVKEAPGSTADIERLKVELRQLRADISELTGTLKHIVAEKAKEGQDKAKEAVDFTGKKIGEHPFISMLIALGAGFLVGFLIERKRSA
jgi:ElaB/YqjD/DUF883 family membrane-anchored ribosome-binding protein